LIGLVDINELRAGDTVWINSKHELPFYFIEAPSNKSIIEVNVLETELEYKGRTVPLMEYGIMCWDKYSCLKETYKQCGYDGFTEVEKLEFIVRIEELIRL